MSRGRGRDKGRGGGIFDRFFSRSGESDAQNRAQGRERDANNAIAAQNTSRNSRHHEAADDGLRSSVTPEVKQQIEQMSPAARADVAEAGRNIYQATQTAAGRAQHAHRSVMERYAADRDRSQSQEKAQQQSPERDDR